MAARHFAAFIPIISLISFVAGIIVFKGAGSVGDYGPLALLASAAIAVGVSAAERRFSLKGLWIGLVKSARQLLPAIPVLACIGLIATTWMLSGIVPLLIEYGINMLNADMFLPIACFVCAVVSVLLGSSWTTIATVGVAFMGIGSVLGYSDGWIAGAIISGAYFGDKVSPLSDTTVIASSSCGVDLFTHIRNLMATSMTAIVISLIIFAFAGMNHSTHPETHATEISAGLAELFNLSPFLLIVPALTVMLCVLRLNSLLTLVISAAMGLVSIFIFQPQIIAMLSGDGGLWATFAATARMLLTSTQLTTGSELLDGLVATGGVAGMLPTIFLVLAAMTFGGTLLGTGLLGDITHTLTSRLRRGSSLVSATAGTGLMLNACTGDQYLSIIIGSNIYRNAYRRSGQEPKLLSRTLEDSVSVTSVLIPWNSCGITQSTVLGVATLTYLPYCFFNYLSPILTVAFAQARDRIAARIRLPRLIWR